MAQIILNVGWAVFKEFIGWNDVVSCFSRGDMWACGSLIIDAIPWSSVFSKGKKIWRAVDKTLSAISAWRKAQEKARKIIAAAKAAREAAKAAAAAAKAAAKKAAQAAAKKAQQAAIRAAKKGAEKTGNALQKTKKAIAKGNEKVKSVAQKVTGKNKKENGRDGVAEEAPSGNGASCPRPNSFVPGTLVVMADGSTKPIEKVKNGDEVLATDPETGETTSEVVTAEITGEGFKHLVKVTIDTDGDKGDKTASVTATDSHPFWVEALGEWVEATDLKSGEWLRTSAGTYVQITAVERWTAPDATVHNLTVNDLHTYYVLAGATPVLVHNCGESDRLQQRAEEVHERLDDIAQNSQDTVAMSTEEGVDVFSGGVRDIRPVQRAALRDGDMEARMMNQHAEVTAVVRATQAGMTPKVLVSHPLPFCPPCRQFLEEEGFRLVDEHVAEMRQFGG